MNKATVRPRFNEIVALLETHDKVVFMEKAPMSWDNGTGYLDGTLKDTDLRYGVTSFETSGQLPGRKGFLAKFGNDETIVVFERYVGEDRVVFNATHGLYRTLKALNHCENAMTDDGMEFIELLVRRALNLDKDGF